jgi:hypothetical protein
MLSARQWLQCSVIAAAVVFGAMGASATSSKGPARSASSYGQSTTPTSTPETSLGSDLTQVGYACDNSGDFPCPDPITGEGSYNSILIVGLNAGALTSGAQVSIDLPSSFDGIGSLFVCSEFNTSFTPPLCTPTTLSETACDDAGSFSDNTFSFTASSTCNSPTFIFDETGSQAQYASLANNSATTPEPNTLAMLGTGILLLGGALKRRVQV